MIYNIILDLFRIYVAIHITNYIFCNIYIFVSPDESLGYLGFSTVMPPLPLQRFPFGHDNLKNILVRPLKFGMWVYMGNATNAVLL